MKNILFTRKQIATLIGVNPVQLRSWSRHPGWFSLPDNAGKPYHRRDVLAAFNRVHRGDATGFPNALATQKELLAHYGINRTRLAAWKARGMPYFAFSDRVLRYVLKEVEVWYLNTYGSRCPSQTSTSKQLPLWS
jgi:hypothetical protein